MVFRMAELTGTLAMPYQPRLGIWEQRTKSEP